jgi:branched-chain amino acid transport system ATP-binding protein
LVEQNAALTLGIADYGYILENGRIVLDGLATDLLADKEVKRYYLGLGKESQRRNYGQAKHYKTRKRWLS